MFNFFEALGIIEDEKDFDVFLYSINNPDGSPRWLWNAQNPNPDFLKFYAINNSKAKIFSFVIKVIFSLKLQHLVFKKSKKTVKFNKQHSLYSYLNKNFALFTGTEGPNRKLILYAEHIFIKIALSETSEAIIENEKKQLDFKQGQYYEIPSIKFYEKGILGISDVGKLGNRENQFSTLHAKALAELYNNFGYREIKFSSSGACNNIDLSSSSFNKQPSAKKIPVFLVQNLTNIKHSIAEESFMFTWSHGDFTPWNLYVGNQKIQLYDLELASIEKTFAFDVFHFVMQQGILVERLPWIHIKQKLEKAFALLVNASSHKEADFQKYLKSYLYTNVTYYLALYAKQEYWHMQIDWLLAVWGEAVVDISKTPSNQRSLLIGNIFDFLKGTKYAAIKFPNTSPLDLSEESDIDLLMQKPQALELLEALQKHCLVKELQISKRSNMISILAVLKNNQLLALDLIWSLKRKSLVFMNTQKALAQVQEDKYGVMHLNKAYTADYLKYFYGLNSAKVPEKYETYFNDKKLNFKLEELRKEIISYPENKGLPAFKNKFNYVMDSLRKTQAKKGIIITFSGVDGAGKSTIIEHTKRIIEKKFRKQVVVIRHRPSLLPILSAYTKGKKKAEENAAKTLPRQGKNKSSLSSFFRFTYYYTDYLFGQFYVYFKYVSQGKVILYDRYYFDFINDSRRSNIDLPKSITKAGYKLLLKPNLNFFLYADAETILARKKELQAKEIESLTKDYLKLFNELDQGKENKYFPIKNIELDETLNFITQKLEDKLLN